MFSAVLGAIGAVASSAINTGLQFWNESENRSAQRDINDANLANQRYINQQNLDYMRSMTQAQWERDDNAFQRQVKDLEAAGLSPLAISGAGSGNSTPVTSPNLEAAQQFPYETRAPQFDINSVINASTRLQNMEELHNENISKRGYRETYLAQKNNELSLKWSELESLNTYRNKELVQQDEHFLRSFELQTQQFEHLKKKDLSELSLKTFCEKNKMVYESLQSQLPDKNLPHKVFLVKDKSTLEKYETAVALYQNQFANYLDSFSRSPAYKAYASSSAKNGNGSVSGAGLGFGIGAGVSGSTYEAEAKDKNQLFNESWVSYCIKNKISYPIPVYGVK